MARLPKPGGDAGDWGEILNEFLRQEHNDDGSFKRSGDIDQLTSDVSSLQTSKADTSTTDDLSNRLSVEHNPDGTLRRLPKGGNRVVFLGDSLTAGQTIQANNQHRGLSFVTLAWILSGGRLRFMPAGNAGVNGDDFGEMLARVQTSVVAQAPDVCVVLGGANDALSGVPVATSISNLTSIVDALRAARIQPVLCTAPPTESKFADINRLNLHIRKLANDEGLPLADLYGAVADPGTGQWRTGYSYDQTHPTRYGAGKLAERLVADLDTVLLPNQPYVTAMQADPINLLNNGVFLGDTNSDGIADGWSGTPTAGRAFSLVPDPAISGNWQQVEITVSGTPMALSQVVSVSGGNMAPGDRLAFSGLIETEHVAVPGDTSATHIRPTLWLEQGGGSSTEGVGTVYVVDQLGTDITKGRFYVETVVPPGMTTINARLTSITTGTGVVRLAQMTLVNLTQQGIV